MVKNRIKIIESMMTLRKKIKLSHR